MTADFYALIFRQRHIVRWGLMRSVTPETLSEHSYEAAVLAHALAVIGNTYFGKHHNAERAALLALFHDATEVFTGDMPTPIKYYNDEMRSIYATIESNAKTQLIEKLPPELRPIYDGILSQDDDPELCRIVKQADVLCALIKCIDEEKSGNFEFSDARKATEKKLRGYKSEELDYFMENLLPAFTKNLDELQSKE